jgi:superfamily II DNA/RNA helicase
VLPEFRLRARELADQAAGVIAHAKLEELSNLLTASPDRVVVFSEHLPTVELIADRVDELGRPGIAFTGSLDRHHRHRALTMFKNEPRAVLIATRSGAEGLNLQFCHQLVNYELPWNPMMVEQRIGRVHRFGQTREVELHNYAAKGTVESHILRLLHTKIRLFELVVGELDLILERMDDDEGESFEGLLGELWLEAESDDAFEKKLDELGDRVTAERTAAIEEEERASAVAAEDAAGRLEREFTALTVPARLRLGYGTVKMTLAPGVESARHELGLHVSELLESLTGGPDVQPAGMHPDYGPLYRVTGVTGSGRAVTLTAQADRLPLTLVELSADPAAPLAA